MLADLFAEHRRITQLLAAAPGGAVASSLVAKLRALSGLIEDFATGAAPPQQSPVHLEAVIAEIIDLLTPLLEEHAISIGVERLCLTEPVVFADRERAQHLLLLLVAMVLEQSTPGDTIVVACRSSQGQLGVSVGALRLVPDVRFGLLGTIAQRFSWRLIEQPGGEARVDLLFDEVKEEESAMPFASSASGFLDNSSRFDEGRLSRLMGGLADDGVRRLRASFVETAQNLSEELDAPNVDSATAHSLKGAAAMVGADVLAELCARLEGIAGQPERATELTPLRAAIKKEIGWLAQRLARPIEPEVNHAERAPPTSLRLMVVDDDPFVRSALAVMLGHLTSKPVTVCASAQEAMEAMARFTESEPLDAIICDLRMPQIDGVTFIRQLADANFRGAVIVVSVADVRLRQSVERLARSLGLQVIASLAKPASSGQLASALSRVQEGLRKQRGGKKVISNVLRGPRWTREDLRAAIQNGGIRPYYQPKVSLRTGRITGAEALARWVHPEFGVISPAAFLPMAATEGLMPEVLLASVDHVSQYLEKFPQLTIALNVEANTACDDEAMARLMKLVQARKISPDRLQFELTESDVDSDPRRMVEILARLHLRGFALSIDDFGTGRSTNQRIADIPFSELKIDRQFVREGCREEASRAVVESSVVLARRLKMTTTAEGVETKEELEFVRGAGCDAVQGFFFAPPLPFEEFVSFVAGFDPALALGKNR